MNKQDPTFYKLTFTSSIHKQWELEAPGETPLAAINSLLNWAKKNGIIIYEIQKIRKAPKIIKVRRKQDGR